MIKITEEATYISGELDTIASQFAIGLRAFYKQLKDAAGEEAANEIFAKIGRTAVMSEEELEAIAKNV